MSKQLQRRTFLASVLAFPSVLLAWRPVQRRKEWQPPPRWEWEVKKWWGEMREWKASADMLPSECQALMKSVSTMNAIEFCGVRTGCIAVSAVGANVVQDGLARVDVSLTQFADYRRDRVCIYDKGGAAWYKVYELINFNDLFRGGNVVLPATKDRERVEAIEQALRELAKAANSCMGKAGDDNV